METVEVFVREAGIDDSPSLAMLMSELGYETSPAEMEQRMRTVLNNPDYATFLAEVAGRICGLIGTAVHPSLEHNDPSGRIIALVVSSQGRRRGIGKALIKAAENHFENKGISRISLTTRFTRTDAHLFYEALGYRRNGWRFVKEKPGSSGYSQKN